MVTTKNKILVLAVVLLMAIVIAMASFSSPSQVKTVRIGTFSRAIDYAPFFIAKNDGSLDKVAAKYGANIEYLEFNSVASINEAFATENLDIGFEAEPQAIIAKAAGIGVEIVANGVSLTQEIIVSNKSGIKSVAELKGKKLAVLIGTSSHYGVFNTLKQNNVPADEVQILDMTPPDARGAFETNAIDAWAVWPPWIEQQEIAGNGVVLPGGNVSINSIIVERTGFIEKNPALSKELLEAVLQEKNFILENPKESQQTISRELGLPIEVVEKAWPRHDFNATLGPSELEDIQAKADFLFEKHIVNRRVNVTAELISQ